MSSRRKSSTNSHHGRSVPDGSSSQHVDVVPKVEFSAGSINPEEVNAYWAARGEVKPPIPGLWIPSFLRPTLWPAVREGVVRMGLLPLDISAEFLS
uniref:Uncharacterized protein n=1 Tax=Brassica oleracea TaxID=3712 RepID=A0A3P6DMT1_BRAOL|nr:unnamed protein product [Brassica oleracea]